METKNVSFFLRRSRKSQTAGDRGSEGFGSRRRHQGKRRVHLRHGFADLPVRLLEDHGAPPDHRPRGRGDDRRTRGRRKGLQARGPRADRAGNRLRRMPVLQKGQDEPLQQPEDHRLRFRRNVRGVYGDSRGGLRAGPRHARSREPQGHRGGPGGADRLRLQRAGIPEHRQWRHGRDIRLGLYRHDARGAGVSQGRVEGLPH